MLDRWERVLAGLESDPESVANWVDWVAKQRLIDGYAERHGLEPGIAELKALDLQYHDLRPERCLARRAGLQTIVDPADVARGENRAADHHTGLFPWPLPGQVADDIVAANWDSLVFDIGRDPLRRVPMMEPLRGTADHVASLIDESDTPAELLDRLGPRTFERKEIRAPWPNVPRNRNRHRDAPRRPSRQRRSGTGVRRQVEGRARRPARRDRRCARDQRRGLRQVVRAKGRPVTVSMPIFASGDDPGSSFPELLRRVGHRRHPPCGGSAICRCPHATTCVALRFADGVVMAGDRRATAGNLISHRRMEKVVQADRYSGVAIAGAAGPAMEMIKLFQLQLEHYEKVEGSSLSLEGKANQLSMMVRGNLPAAMQGMVVVPIFAGFDLRARPAGCSPTTSPVGATRSTTTSPPVRAACTPAPSSRSATATGMSRDDAIHLACQALWEAADADSATGGPDAAARHLPDRGDDHGVRLAAGQRRRAGGSASRTIASEVRAR